MPDLSVTRIFVSGINLVGKLLVVVEKVLSTCDRDRLRMLLDAESPASDVGIVDAVVAKITGAKVVPPMPRVMQSVWLEWNKGGRADPFFVIKPVGRNGRFGVTDVRPPLAVPRFGNQYVTYGAVAQHLHGFHDGR